MDDPDSLARLAYLALLGAFIIAGVLAAYRGRMGRGLRDAAIWLLIILGFVTLYGFKDTLMGGLFPQRATVAGDEIRLRRGEDGHFRAQLEVNGVPVLFVIDTGASDVVLTRRDAQRVGIDLGALRYTETAQTANGPVKGAPVVLRTITLGGVTDRNIRATVNQGDLFGSLLGMSYLDRFRRITVEGDRLTLVR